jgi:ABC-type Fe3+/spermidine/putrescine transport system ATPase subunit
MLPASATRDKAVTVMIRPEDIELTHDGSRDGNGLSGIVVGASFLGSLVDYSVQTHDLVLHVQVPRSARFDRGDRVHVYVQPEQCVGIE